MKKFLALFLALLLTLTMVACGEKAEQNGNATTTTTTTTTGSTTTTAQQTKPESYAGYLRIEINPAFEVYFDANKTVIGVLCLNADALSVADGLSLIGTSCVQALETILNAAEQKGFDIVGAHIDIQLGNQSAIGQEFYEGIKADIKALTFTLEVVSPTTNVTTSTTASTTTTTVKSTTTTAKPTTTTTKAAGNKNPQTDLEYFLEYIGNFKDQGDMLVAGALQFETGDEPVAVVTDRYFEAEKTDPEQVAFEYFGKQWYSVGGGQTPHKFELTSTEIIVKGCLWDANPDVVNIRLVLQNDGTLKVTEVCADLAYLYPVGTEMKIYFR